jgi:hypothetical protein
MSLFTTADIAHLFWRGEMSDYFPKGASRWAPFGNMDRSISKRGPPTTNCHFAILGLR